MSLGSRVQFEPIRLLAGADITQALVAIGGPFAHSIVILAVTNTTNVDIQISFDGEDEHAVLTSGQTRMWNFASNANSTSSALSMAQGTQVWALYLGADAPDVGGVFVEAAYSS